MRLGRLNEQNDDITDRQSQQLACIHERFSNEYNTTHANYFGAKYFLRKGRISCNDRTRAIGYKSSPALGVAVSIASPEANGFNFSVIQHTVTRVFDDVSYRSTVE
jgi:hypothetical protein